MTMRSRLGSALDESLRGLREQRDCLCDFRDHVANVQRQPRQDALHQSGRIGPLAEIAHCLDMYSGTLQRCPDIRFILAHAGGALPMVARRVEEMSMVYAARRSPTALEETVAQVASFYFDLAISAHDNAIAALREVSSIEHVLFACNWPFAPDPAIKINVAGFEALKITPEERHAIERGNAARLFPRLATA